MCQILGFGLILLYASILWVLRALSSDEEGVFMVEDHKTNATPADVEDELLSPNELAARFLQSYPVLNIFVAAGFVGIAITGVGFVIPVYLWRSVSHRSRRSDTRVGACSYERSEEQKLPARVEYVPTGSFGLEGNHMQRRLEPSSAIEYIPVD
ncbi:unnamed protein product [Amoebophrya sp. A25]|nr:unnamed protein product [Amoebophrya sp. A25]|eukprot:GSA25T00020147001.1